MISSASPSQSTLTDLQTRKLMKLFGMYDADNSGVLKLHNFQTLIDRLAQLRGWRSDSPEYTRISDKFMHRWLHMKAEIKDRLRGSKDGSITLEEWLGFYGQVLSDNTYRDHIYEVTSLIFDAVDVDANGHLNLDEWRQLFRVYGIPVIYAPEAFSRIDLDGDRQLSKDEVLQRVEEFYYSQDPHEPGNYMFGPV